MAGKILVTDDEPDLELIIRQKFRSRIKSGELNFEFAENGAVALEKLKADPTFDLVFTDINMPVMNGIEMIEKMLEDHMLEKLPVVIVSTEGSKTRIEELFRKGVRAYLRKPITPEIVRNVVKEVLGDYDAK